ncbi:PREDICTED: 40S ribosomal protein S3a [Tinamus guttatus]|nr:PREDICTED: 40S ribosomal protein S3a [Tinamus guttatus]
MPSSSEARAATAMVASTSYRGASAIKLLSPQVGQFPRGLLRHSLTPPSVHAVRVIHLGYPIYPSCMKYHWAARNSGDYKVIEKPIMNANAVLKVLATARLNLRNELKSLFLFELRVDPFSKKDWYDVKAPAMFNIRNIGKTLVTRTQGTKIASDGLKGRVFEVSLADLQNDEVAFRKFKLVTEDVQGKNCLTNFHGMDLTRDKMCSMVKKWQTMIEAHIDVKTTDGYLLRLFCVGFTKKRNNQIRKTSYAQHQQVRQIRKKMMEIMTREVQTNDLKEVVNKL